MYVIKIVWIEKLPVSENNENFSLFNDDEFQSKILSDIRCLFDNDEEYKTDILSDIRYMFQPDEQFNIENNDVLKKYALRILWAQKLVIFRTKVS